jgi:putative PIN family toxin of toxin-antitoxin system
MRIVLDTNVIVAGLRSRLGASFRILSDIGTESFEIALSVPLVLEYEDALARLVGEGLLEPGDVDTVLDYLCSVSHQQRIFYLWRPFLRDPSDDMVLELAVAAKCALIVTHNQRDFAGCEAFGVQAVLPGSFLRRTRRKP